MFFLENRIGLFLYHVLPNHIIWNWLSEKEKEKVLRNNIIKNNLTYKEAEKYSPLAMRLMTVTGVKQVFLAKDYVSVTKEDDWDWNVLKPLVMTGVMQHLTTNGPIVSDDYKRLKEKAAGPQKERSSEENEIIDQIKALLDERVRPAVAQDGGDIEFFYRPWLVLPVSRIIPFLAWVMAPTSLGRRSCSSCMGALGKRRITPPTSPLL